MPIWVLAVVIAAFVATGIATFVVARHLRRSQGERHSGVEDAVESRRRLEGIVNSAMDAIITIDERQKIVLFNPAAERMFACSSEAALGESIEHFIPERFRKGHEEHIRRFRETGVTNRRMGALGAISGVRASGEEFPIEASISQVEIGGERLSTVILRDITERRTSEEARLLLAREVDHRAKNALAVAQALVTLTKAGSVEELSQAIKGRIAALARAHSLLSQSQWRGAPLDQVIRDELAPYAKDGQLTLDGPLLSAGADAVQSLNLLFHELATNAVKYGALSSPEGRVCVSWTLSGVAVKVLWEERGGPAVTEPEGSGFGSKLLHQVAVRQLGAALDFGWHAEGLKVWMELPRALFMTQGSSAPAGFGEAAEAPVDKPHKGKVLIVEDEELVAMEMADELSQLGWLIVGHAASIRAAQAFLSIDFDVAVLDVNLRGRPVYPFAETLLARNIPFVFCTGYELVDPDGRFPHAPVIRKPAAASAVSAAMQNLVPA